MKTFLRLFLAAVAVCVLGTYYFADLVLGSGAEIMSWEEFSVNSGALARLKAQHEDVDGGGASLQQAYEHYVARVQTSGNLAAAGGKTSGGISGLKLLWRGVYKRFSLSPGRLRTGPGVLQRWTSQPERLGALVTLVLLAGGIAGLSSAISWMDRKARA